MWMGWVGTGEYARSGPGSQELCDKSLLGRVGRVIYLTDKSRHDPYTATDVRYASAHLCPGPSNPKMIREQENRLLGRLPAAERDRLAPHLEPVNLYFGEVLVEFD